ncbi:zinc finger MYM-type protein 5-like isoform X6 [Tamandua tetradactyla]|uniref:zinc finger MYM-type protein 5-like isoform X6 n=1 Tax=Tamandua tetradactyla TaxID=48850 RepID=UPI0040543637
MRRRDDAGVSTGLSKVDLVQGARSFLHLGRWRRSCVGVSRRRNAPHGPELPRGARCSLGRPTASARLTGTTPNLSGCGSELAPSSHRNLHKMEGVVYCYAMRAGDDSPRAEAGRKDEESGSARCGETLAEVKEENIPVIFDMDTCSVGGLESTEQNPLLLESTTMAPSLMNVGNTFGNPTSPLVNRSRNSSVEDDDDDDVVFIESIQPPSISAPVVAEQRNVKFTSSKNTKLQGNYSVILPSSRDFISEKGNKSETIVIDDEEDIETNQRKETNFSSFNEWGLPGTKIRTKDLDFSTSSLSRSKTKTGVGPFNPGRMNVAGDVFQNGGFATQHNPGKHCAFLACPADGALQQTVARRLKETFCL